MQEPLPPVGPLGSRRHLAVGSVGDSVDWLGCLSRFPAVGDDWLYSPPYRAVAGPRKIHDPVQYGEEVQRTPDYCDNLSSGAIATPK